MTAARRFPLAIAVVLAVLLCAPLASHVSSAPMPQADDVSGSLLYLYQNAIWRMDLLTLERGLFLRDPGANITYVAHSWDRQQIAYSAFVRGERFEIADSKIVVARADGGDARMVVHETGGTTVEWPSWSPDGAALVYTKSSPLERGQRIEEADLGTGERHLITDAGSSPSYAPDGGSIVFASPFDRPWGIWRAPRAGGDPGRLVPDVGFADADAPIFVPDGRAVAFVAAQILGPPDPISTPFALPPFQLLGIASAHPLPGAQFDLWTVQPDGSGLRQVAPLFSEEPYLAWSPDGQYLASWGRQGLQLIDIGGESEAPSVRWVTAVAGYGPISWGQ